MRVLTNLGDRESFSVTNLLAGTQFWIFPPKFEQECAEPLFVVMTHHTAKANLEKGSSWPPEAVPYGLPHTMGLVLIQATCPTPWTRPQIPMGARPPLTIRLLKKDTRNKIAFGSFFVLYKVLQVCREQAEWPKRWRKKRFNSKAREPHKFFLVHNTT